MAAVVVSSYVALIFFGRHFVFMLFLLSQGGPLSFTHSSDFFWTNLFVSAVSAPLIFLDVSKRTRTWICALTPTVLGSTKWLVLVLYLMRPGESFLSFFYLGCFAVVITSWLLGGLMGAFVVNYLDERLRLPTKA